MRRTLRTVGLMIALALVVAIVRTLMVPPKEAPPAPPEPVALDRAAMVEHLASAIRCPTVSSSTTSSAAFSALHGVIRAAFPRVHAALEREQIGRSLLYTWKGRGTAAPIVFLAHLDVVPVEGVASWSAPPFGGETKGGFLYGRGALDDKIGVFGLLEAVEALLAEGRRPARTVILAFGADEELGGGEGAQRVAERLAARGVRAEAIIDEGGAITDGIFPGVDVPIALIGISEKGYVSLELKAKTDGGHSSIPPEHTAIGVLSRAVTRLESNPFPHHLTHVGRLFIEALAPDVSFLRRMAFANLWATKPILEWVMSQKPSTRAALHTTTAVTMIQSGVKENVLPTEARAIVNFRIVPGETIESVITRVTEVIDDPRVSVTPTPGFASEAAPEASVDSRAYKAIGRAVRQLFPSAAVVPSLVLGATDSRRYRGLAPDIYRFGPMLLRQDDLARVHGVDERISLEGIELAVRFYRQVVMELGEVAK
jgi:carboxypeptidase PM20D1